MNYKYSQIGRCLNDEETTRFLQSLSDSEILELRDELPTGELNHIVIKGTNRVVGYFGADNQVEKVGPKDTPLRMHHVHLERLYYTCLNENQRLIPL